VLVWNSLNYVSQVCEREILTVDYFAMLGVGLPASVELSCGAKETTFTEANSKTLFRRCGLFSCNLSAETNSFGLGPVLLSFVVSELKEDEDEISNLACHDKPRGREDVGRPKNMLSDQINVD
jgi:hypothetical protein